VLQAGAGIVYDSVPEREYEETENKLRALTVAAGLSVGTSNDGPSTAERRSGAVPVTADGDTADADVSTAERRSGANAGEPA
jgi:hypothetical protein